jgi:hypothetical protein
MWTQNEPDLKEIKLVQRESHRGGFPSIQVGERHLQGLIDKCHESREKFLYFRDKNGMMQNVSLVEREC